jgi:Asp-tRNA(Asn)/Glu-tRNA(Gln) amidotransferase B subunit
MMEGKSLVKIIKDKGKQRVSDQILLKKLSTEVIEENSKIVEDCRKNLKAIEALIGKVMVKTHGQADPEITRGIMISVLKEKRIIN